MHLGVCNNTGLVYEGMGAADIPSIPTPNVAQAKLIEAEGDWKNLPRGLSVDPLRWLLREDSFDPVIQQRRHLMQFSLRLRVTLSQPRSFAFVRGRRPRKTYSLDQR